ncbi:hypothetical protein [Mycobacterium heckeshornense]|uniref:hypothetical protein n=1 Tax=Mycobacterium heckeshornense TaxID=110505 RepID=UPI001364B771|nr:hypothetical protein [Mycobacterium heckeshornense]MCV7032984.1 hypothetical protein [Mycobacterium heckeshornense]
MTSSATPRIPAAKSGRVVIPAACALGVVHETARLLAAKRLRADAARAIEGLKSRDGFG